MLKGSHKPTETEYIYEFNAEQAEHWLKTVSAFANSRGGTLIFGIDVVGNVCGLKNVQKDNQAADKLIKEHIEPLPDFHLREDKKDDKDVLILQIDKGSHTPYYYNDNGIHKAFVRIVRKSMQAPSPILNELILKGFKRTYDTKPDTHEKDSCDFTLLEEKYLKRTGTPLTKEDYISYGLTTKDGRLTKAGMLLADQVLVQHSRLCCTRWIGLTKGSILEHALDDEKYDGGLITLLGKGIDFIRDNARVRFAGLEKNKIADPDFAEKAVVEAVVNALIHRNYFVLDSYIRIDIFDDRMEILSPGGMYDMKIVQQQDINNVS